MAAAEPEELRLVCFFLHGREFGVDIRSVKETIILRPLTRVFLTPDWVAGIINLRGDVVAVVDLARFMGLPRTHSGDDTRIVLARGKTKTAGFLVDKLSDVRSVSEGAIRPPPPGVSEDGGELLRGVVSLDGVRPLAVLDLNRLWVSDRIKQFERRVNG